MYSFEWDKKKEASNISKHGVDFTTASMAFHDPWHIMRCERIENGECRWQTLGMVRGQLVLIVAHTVIESDDNTIIRIISARKADKKERKTYGNN